MNSSKFKQPTSITKKTTSRGLPIQGPPHCKLACSCLAVLNKTHSQNVFSKAHLAKRIWQSAFGKTQKTCMSLLSLISAKRLYVARGEDLDSRAPAALRKASRSSPLLWIVYYMFVAIRCTRGKHENTQTLN